MTRAFCRKTARRNPAGCSVYCVRYMCRRKAPLCRTFVPAVAGRFCGWYTGCMRRRCAGTGICPEVRVYSGSTGGIVLHILFLAIWTANVFALWKNGPAKASPLGAALGVFFLVWGVGGRGAVWLGRGGMPAGVLGLGLGLLLAFTGVFRLRNVYACRLPARDVYCSCNMYVSKNAAQCALVFEYTVDGQRIRTQSAEAVGRRELEKCYREGGSYEIFVDEKHPRFFVLQRRVHLFGIGLLASALLCAALRVYCFFAG